MDRKIQRALETEATVRTAEALQGLLPRLDRLEADNAELKAMLIEIRAGIADPRSTTTPERKGGRAS